MFYCHIESEPVNVSCRTVPRAVSPTLEVLPCVCNDCTGTTHLRVKASEMTGVVLDGKRILP